MKFRMALYPGIDKVVGANYPGISGGTLPKV